MNLFDKEIDRHNTQSIKWDVYGEDVLPFWVADMDFLSPPEITDAICKRAKHGIYGYTRESKELTNLIVKRLWDLYSWKVSPEWIVYTPAVVSSINVFCQMMEGVHDEIACFSPVYYCLLDAPVNAGKKLLSIPLGEHNNRWKLDSEIFESKISKHTQGLLLCNPHNPVGRVFSKQELESVATVCNANDIFICSDEIHCDLILDKTKRHIPIASLDADTADRCVTLMSPGKIFNTPGLSFAFAIISNQGLRERFIRKSKGIVPFVNILGYEGAYAAYTKGEKWLTNLIDYLENNYNLLQAVVADIDGISIAPLEATYLAWIDIRNRPDITAKSFLKNGIALSDGKIFGKEGFVRFNLASPVSMIEEGLKRFRNTFKK